MRPWVYQLATQRRMRGTVCNDAAGVCILVSAESALLDDFVRALGTQPPPLARIERIDRTPVSVSLEPGFHIVDSTSGPARTGITADAATCAACLQDIGDRGNRRWQYAFTNCTHCGPRFSIQHTVPYDRPHTSMQVFPLCLACQREYADPGDRRFHAQPNACADCGPQPWLERADGAQPTALATGGTAIDEARRLLLAGHIVAMKGLGGFHLACDATNTDAVQLLRTRKQRHHKPFAMMARDLQVAGHHCVMSEQERVLLQGPVAPIVLLTRLAGSTVATAVAGRHSRYGFMLPYTPLHHLLLQGVDMPLVFTSGNRSDEPQCIANDEARTALAGIADFLLLHDRDIINRVDDSIARVDHDVTRWLRRARGLAPASLALPAGFDSVPAVLAMGGELKNSFCLLQHGHATLSHHLGDLENAAAWAAYQETMSLYQRSFDHAPAIVAVDLHPDYLSTRLGTERARQRGLTLVQVQHHHAHIAACMAENGVALHAPPVLGIALDGLGMGGDGTFWGGEFLLADYRDSRRLAAFKPIAMPGAAQVMREPWRMAYAYLAHYLGAERLLRQHAGLAFVRDLPRDSVAVLDAMLRAGFNCPKTSSCGRLFDAVSALAGICRVANYEGQAAIELQASIDHDCLQRGERYDMAVLARDDTGMCWLDTARLWPLVLRDLANGCTSGQLAARFHNGLARAIVDTVIGLARQHGNPWQNRIALSGGVFQNDVVLGAVTSGLQDTGHTVYSHALVPCNDGGLSLGQAVVAAARFR